MANNEKSESGEFWRGMTGLVIAIGAIALGLELLDDH